MPVEIAPLIVSALLVPEDFAWLDALRRAHFPPERNRLPAHLTLFRHLPPSLLPELKHRLGDAVRSAPPRAETAGLIDLDGGVAVRIASPALEGIRADLASSFRGLLTPQDQAGWRPHVTIQNKVAPAEARALKSHLETDLRPRPLRIDGLAAFAYRDGLWEPLSRHMFRR
ncbi:MAG: 2'-5' RNA ligase family protein [Sphingomonas sp.]|nr:2'-5' RNA ligase family protein [Sphingomonas sp.]